MESPKTAARLMTPTASEIVVGALFCPADEADLCKSRLENQKPVGGRPQPWSIEDRQCEMVEEGMLGRRRSGKHGTQWFQRHAVPPLPPLAYLYPKCSSDRRRRLAFANQGLLRRVIQIFDSLLRVIHGVFEFTSYRHCMLRIALKRADASILLKDGVCIDKGAWIIELHLWNEQLMMPPAGGPTFAWVARLRRQVIGSLQVLAAYCEQDPAGVDAVAIRARVAFASIGRSKKMARIACGFGFEPISNEQRPDLRRRVHDFFDNFWLLGLLWTFNPHALGGHRFTRERQEFWISRAALISRFGGHR
jgi:hypothetical protein